VRDARNGAAFLDRVRAETGFETVLLTGAEEAEATVAGVLSDHPSPRPLVVVDVGGGSTELASVRERRVEMSVSLQLGCVRATERWLGEDRIGAPAIEEARAAIHDLLIREAAGIAGTSVVAVAGTAITAAAVDLGVEPGRGSSPHGHVVDARLLDDLIARLAPLTVRERAGVRGIEPERAPVIVGGLIVLVEVLRHLGADAFRVSERDILHGTVLALARAVP
jgi:exopolyphosphatase/guanosine-5'-triphosphate,3'-diphosphate pyrophosphatase